MNIVIVGNGMVSHKFCEKLVAKANISTFNIVVFGEEIRPAYDRVHLSEYFAGKSADDLSMAPASWYAGNNIKLYLWDPIQHIDRFNKKVTSFHGIETAYDVLILATGSSAFVPDTNDIVKMTKRIETLIFQHKSKLYDNVHANGEWLYELINKENYITKPVDAPLKLPPFNLSYYEGLNRYNDKSWLGIYRRDELFRVDFLKEVCLLCLQTKIGQLCSSPWKSLIIKGIEEKDRQAWSNLLAKHRINMRHAANELNFQVEDNCREGLALKKYLVKHFGDDDTRTFGLCIGIKTRKKNEVFSSILVRRRPLLQIGRLGFFYVYDILCATNFNPNERTGFVFSKNNPKILLPEQIRSAVWAFYTEQAGKNDLPLTKDIIKKDMARVERMEYLHQCSYCLTVYDEAIGEPENNIPAGISFNRLPEEYCCPLCEAPKKDFRMIEKNKLGLQAI